MNKKENCGCPSKNAFSEKGKQYKGAIEEEFDLIVVGSGPGGYLAAEIAGKSGQKVLIVEKEFWGGVCLNVGCIPTKTMLASTEKMDEIKEFKDFGLVGNFDEVKIDYNESWKKMHERKAAVVKQISGSVKMLMKMSKCKILEAEAKFVGAHEVEVENKVYRGKNIIIATGSKARKLPLPGFAKGYENKKVITSREAINWSEKLPKSVVIVGGGVIGVEFAQVFASSSSKVTIIQNTAELLPFVDRDVVKEVTKSLVKHDVEIIYNASTIALNEKDELVYKVGEEEKTIFADVYLLAVGRIPNSEGLEEVGIKLNERGGVIVDDELRTNVEGVYAIGDVTGQSMLAHVAYRHAVVAVKNLLGEKSRYSGKDIPGCIYTSPEIAFTGLTEDQAKANGFEAFSAKYPFSHLGKAIAARKTEGFFKLVVDKTNGEILGAHAIGANVTDYIAEIDLAMDKKLTVHDIASTIHPHPTFNEIVWEAARSADHKLMMEKRK